MNKKFVAVSIDSLLKTFSAVDAGESVSFQITSEDGPAISVDDCVLGFIGHGIDEFRIAFVVTEVEDDALLLSKVIERSEGVPIAAYATSLLSQLQSLASPGAIVELPSDVGGDILGSSCMTVGIRSRHNLI